MSLQLEVAATIASLALVSQEMTTRATPQDPLQHALLRRRAAGQVILTVRDPCEDFHPQTYIPAAFRTPRGLQNYSL